MFGDKLREILEIEGISPAQFADTIGVNRSAISHVLNGRNKPGYDFINKMHEHFPDWDYDWLIFNKKKQVKSTKTAPVVTKAHKQEDVTNYQQGSLFDDKGHVESQKPLQPSRISRSVTKTILIYSDGTFEIFQNNFK